MNLQLDPASPLPLYHQLAEALRYRIATGALTPGTRPPVAARRRPPVGREPPHRPPRLHRARRAGSRPHRGPPRHRRPRRQPPAARRRPSASSSRMLHEARERFGLSAEEVRARLGLLDQDAGGAGETVLRDRVQREPGGRPRVPGARPLERDGPRLESRAPGRAARRPAGRHLLPLQRHPHPLARALRRRPLRRHPSRPGALGPRSRRSGAVARPHARARVRAGGGRWWPTSRPT